MEQSYLRALGKKKTKQLQDHYDLLQFLYLKVIVICVCVFVQPRVCFGRGLEGTPRDSRKGYQIPWG